MIAAVESEKKGYLQVFNEQNKAIEVTVEPYGYLTAYMLPGECIMLGIYSGTMHYSEVVRCDIDTDDDCSGPIKTESFSVNTGETATIRVTSEYF